MSDTKPKPEYQHRLAKFRDKVVAIQEKGGVIVTGTAGNYRDGFLKIFNPVIIGRAVKAKPEYVLVSASAIAHIHEDVPTEKIVAEA